MNLAVQLYSNAPSNPLGIPGVWPASVIELGDSTTLPDGSYQLMTDDELATYRSTHQSAYDAWYFPWLSSQPANIPKPTQVEITAQPPFAQPTYRTKRDGAAWIDCPAGTVTPLDFVLTEERYVSGGEVIFKGAQEGDYVMAEVFDLNSVIPSPYRAALCEAWPSVAKYIVKLYLKPTTDYGAFTIDTYPLNAKVSAGLSLRVSYGASAAAGTRRMTVNYHLTKALV